MIHGTSSNNPRELRKTTPPLQTNQTLSWTHYMDPSARLANQVHVGHALGELPGFPLRFGGIRVGKQVTHESWVLSLSGQQR